jgi:hypothetical protein
MDERGFEYKNLNDIPNLFTQLFIVSNLVEQEAYLNFSFN